MKKISKEEASIYSEMYKNILPHKFPHGTFISVEEESKIACPHTRCFYGGGMGMGHCAGGGDPFDKNCSSFKDEGIALKEWEEYEKSLSESDKGEENDIPCK